VDGYLWSTADDIAGLSLKTIENGVVVPLTGGNPAVSNPAPGKLRIAWPLKSGKGTLIINLDEKKLTVTTTGKSAGNWFLDLNVAAKASLPFQTIGNSDISCSFQGLNYRIYTPNGRFSKLTGKEVFRIKPTTNSLTLNFSEGY
jgi:hypothetical protein